VGRVKKEKTGLLQAKLAKVRFFDLPLKAGGKMNDHKNTVQTRLTDYHGFAKLYAVRFICDFS
jgi:hypothetical protein